MSEVGDIAKSAAGLAKSIQTLIAPFSDPVLSELGSYVAEKIRFLRFRQGMRCLDKAAVLLRNRGIEPRAVEAKILVPLLEGASLEEEPELQSAWTELLATAASEGVRVAFPSILKELGPREAQILWCLGKSGHLNKQDLAEYEGYAASCQNLARLGLIMVSPMEIRFSGSRQIRGIDPARREIRHLEIEIDEIRRHLEQKASSQVLLASRKSWSIRLTDLGIEFVSACTGTKIEKVEPPTPNRRWHPRMLRRAVPKKSNG